ncbi:putative reverse transcriptase domain-containing protein [Tanacetum coccineum]
MEAQNKASKVINTLAERLLGFEKQLKGKEDNGISCYKVLCTSWSKTSETLRISLMARDFREEIGEDHYGLLAWRYGDDGGDDLDVGVVMVSWRRGCMAAGGRSRRGVVPTKKVADAKKAIQEMVEYSKKWHNGISRGRSTETSDGMAAIQAQLNNLGREIKKVNEKVYVAQVGSKRHEENSNLIKEIRASTDAAIRNQGASIKTLEIQIRQISKKGSYGPQFLKAYSKASHIDESIPQKEKDPRSFTLPCFINNVCFDNAFFNLGASVSVMPLLTYLNLGLGELAHTKLTVEFADRTVRYLKGIAKNILVRIGKFTFPVNFIILDMPEDIKVPLILERSFLSTACAKIDVYKRKITLRVGEEKIIFKSVKFASSLIKRVYMLSLRERMELDLEARLMGETLILNRSLDPFFEDYIELNDLNKPFELRRIQGEVYEEFRTRDEDLDIGIDDYPSYCDYDKKIHIDCAHNLKFLCMIGFEFTYINFFPLLYVNVMSKKFHNSIMKDKMVYKGDNVVGALLNVHIFVGTFSVVTDFAVLEDMDAYHDEGMGDVIVGEPFLREVGIKARRFDGMITIYNGNDEVTYQMVRSHPRFKHHTNEQCNKIPPLLKDPITFEMQRWKNGSHAGTLACMRWNSEKELKTSLT